MRGNKVFKADFESVQFSERAEIILLFAGENAALKLNSWLRPQLQVQKQPRQHRSNDKDTRIVSLYNSLQNKHLVSSHPWFLLPCNAFSLPLPQEFVAAVSSRVLVHSVNFSFLTTKGMD